MWFENLWRTKDLDAFDQAVPRERLIQSGRIVLIDDEPSLLVGELKTAGFAVDEDRAGDDLRRLDQQIYDLAILDYYGVGARLGAAQGLELLKHIRRVSPRTRVMAYTSRSLSASESEFFRLSNSVLPKDLGLVESLALIEAELRKAFAKQHLFDALVAKLALSDPQAQLKAKKALSKALAGGGEDSFKAFIRKLAGTAAEKAVDQIIARLFGV